jgi:inositol phosphorylceramide mannosyltransferase catalytic subunit
MIPKVMHRIWVGSEMPAEFIAYGRGWQERHPEWTHVLWTDHPQPEMPGVSIAAPFGLRNQDLYDAAATLAPKNVGQFKADVLRYELLLDAGGVYVDCDFECLRPLDGLLTNIGSFVAWERNGIWLNNAIMGAVPHLDFFAQLVGRLKANVTANVGKRPNIMSGPQFLTAVYRQRRRARLTVPTVFAQALFYPYSWNELHRKGQPFPQAYAVHHWNNRRRVA